MLCGVGLAPDPARPDGAVLLDTTADPSFQMAPVQFSPGTPLHTIENPGPDDIVVINVELLAHR